MNSEWPDNLAEKTVAKTRKRLEQKVEVYKRLVQIVINEPEHGFIDLDNAKNMLIDYERALGELNSKYPQ